MLHGPRLVSCSQREVSPSCDLAAQLLHRARGLLLPLLVRRPVPVLLLRGAETLQLLEPSEVRLLVAQGARLRVSHLLGAAVTWHGARL